MADLLTNTGSVISYPTLKEAIKQFDISLKCINDGIAAIDLSNYTESNLRSLSVIMDNDILRMKQQPHIPVHFLIVSASSPNISFDDIGLCPVKYYDGDSIRQPFDFKDRLSAMEYRIIEYTVSKSDEIIEIMKLKIRNLDYYPFNLENKHNTYLILTITYSRGPEVFSD